MKLKWFETVKYKIVPTSSLSHFFEVNHVRKVKAVEEVIRGNTQALSLKVNISSEHMYGEI